MIFNNKIFIYGFGSRTVIVCSYCLDPRPKPPKKKINLGLDLEFNSINFGIKINKCLKFLRPKKVWVQKKEKFF